MKERYGLAPSEESVKDMVEASEFEPSPPMPLWWDDASYIRYQSEDLAEADGPWWDWTPEEEGPQLPEPAAPEPRKPLSDDCPF